MTPDAMAPGPPAPTSAPAVARAAGGTAPGAGSGPEVVIELTRVKAE